MGVRIFIIFCALLHVAGAVEWVSGAWNGKPWDRDKLEKGVESHDSDALAEWSYCSFFTDCGVQQDLSKSVKFAVESAEKGSVLGESLQAYYLMIGTGGQFDPKKGLEILHKLEPKGHPFTQFCVAQSYTFAAVRQRDLRVALPMLKRLADDGVVQAQAVHGFFLLDRNLDQALSVLRNCLLEHQNSTSAGLLYIHLDTVREQYGEELVEKVLERVMKAAELGNENAQVRIAKHAMTNKNYGEAIRFLTLAAQQGNDGAIEELLYYVVNNDEYPVNMELQDRGRLARIAYNKGSRDKRVLRLYAEMLIDQMPQSGDYAKECALIEELSRKAINLGDCNMHDPYAHYLLKRFAHHGAPVEVFDLGESHYVYHSGHHRFNTYMVAFYYLLKERNERFDLVKGLAAIENARPLCETQAHKKSLQGLYDRVIGQATEQQIVEAKELAKRGFPFAEEFRREAFEKLVKAGELAADAEF